MILFLFLTIIAFIFFFWVIYLLNQDQDVEIIEESEEGCLDKFGQMEHEIDILSRSYIIESLHSSRDAENTFHRLEYLTEQVGDCLGRCFSPSIGKEYSRIKKMILQEFKLSITQEGDYAMWYQYEKDLGKLFGSDRIISNRKDHCHLMTQLVEAHIKRNTMAGMVLYDAIIDKNDLYIDSIKRLISS